jgi:hypothetical protein
MYKKVTIKRGDLAHQIFVGSNGMIIFQMLHYYNDEHYKRSYIISGD